MNTNSSLIQEMREKEYRDGYIAAQVAIGIPNQIRALRAQYNLTQDDLAKRAKMAQPRICELEKPGERRANLDTLMRIASAFDIGLEVRFAPFSELITSTENFDPDTFNVKSFVQELEDAERREKLEQNAYQQMEDACAEIIYLAASDAANSMNLPVIKTMASESLKEAAAAVGTSGTINGVPAPSSGKISTTSNQVRDGSMDTALSPLPDSTVLDEPTSPVPVSKAFRRRRRNTYVTTGRYLTSGKRHAHGR
ncbi:MAG: helix-turn-helix transcriptional regulator [Terriglobia bacterium]